MLKILNIFRKTVKLDETEGGKLGSGGYGFVCKGIYEKKVAVKKILKEHGDSEKITKARREMEEHKGLDHENVLRLLYVDDTTNKDFTYLVLELCAGTLTDFCGGKYKGPMLPPDELVLYQIANGLNYIHSRDLVHRDVKPDNILISISTPITMKLSDFGFIKKVGSQETFSQSGLKGTLNWMAPEMLEILNSATDETEVLPRGTVESDTFSAGCVFFYFVSRGLHPFGSLVLVPSNIVQNNPMQFNSYMQSLRREDSSSQNLCKIIEEMIKKKEERVKLSDVIKRLTSLLNPFCQFKEMTVSLPLKWDARSCFHPKKSVLACSYDGTVIFFASANGSIPFSNWKQQQIKLQTQHDANIVELNFNGNGTQLAAGCISGDVYVWNYPGCELLFQTKQHLELIKDIEWNPIRHDWLATFTFLEGRVCLYSSSSKSVTKIYNTSIDYMRYINCVKWISENQIALAPAACGGIEIWDVHEMQSNMSAKIVRKYEVNDRISHLHWIENTKYLASCASSIKIWSTDCEEPIYSSNSWQRSGIYYFTWCPNLKPREDIEAERKSPNNFIFACAMLSGEILIWNPLDKQQENRILSRMHEKWANAFWLAFSPDGRLLSSSSDYANDIMILWSTETWTPMFTIRAPYGFFHPPSWWSGDTNEYKITCHRDNHLHVIEYTVGNETSLLTRYLKSHVEKTDSTNSPIN